MSDSERLKIKGFFSNQENENKSVEVAIMMSAKYNSSQETLNLTEKVRLVRHLTKDTSIHKEDVTILNIYRPSNAADTFIKWKL